MCPLQSLTLAFLLLVLHISAATDIDAKASYVDAGVEALAQGDYVTAANLLGQAAQLIPAPYDGKSPYEDSSTLTNLATALGGERAKRHRYSRLGSARLESTLFQATSLLSTRLKSTLF